jgi:glycosyltransferase involved in cell wall biosynthesis
MELIIVNNGSSDNTGTILSSLAIQDDRIKIIDCDIPGAAAARNMGIDNAKGRYIAFLDSDDLWHTEKLKIQIEFMQRSGHPFTHTWYNVFIDNPENVVAERRWAQRYNRQQILMNCRIGCSTVIYDIKYFGKIKMPSLLKRQDYGLWVTLLEKVDAVYCLPETLSYYRIGHSSLSSNKLKLIKYHWEIYRKVAKCNFLSSLFYISSYLSIFAFRVIREKIRFRRFGNT